jgi:hypothetical protein
VSDKVELDFMVVPEELAKLAYVPDPVRVKVVDPDAIFLTGILGESGRKLVAGGVEFYFTRKLAEKLIARGIAVEMKAALAFVCGGCKYPTNCPADIHHAAVNGTFTFCSRRERMEHEQGGEA